MEEENQIGRGGIAEKRVYRRFEDRVGDVYQIILANPNGIRPKEIKEILGRSPTVPLKILLLRGEVRKEREGKIVRYYPQEQPSRIGE